MKQQVSLITVLNNIATVKFPMELVSEMSKWDEIHKSPYSLSYYNAEVNWGFKPHNSLRISDHWNFKSQGKFHCCTTTPIQKNVWSIGKFDSNLNKYHILRTFNENKLAKNTFLFKFYHLNESYKMTLKKQPENEKYLNYSFLTKYYSILEKFSINPILLSF